MLIIVKNIYKILKQKHNNNIMNCSNYWGKPDGSIDFCGTHIKGTPHGIITDKPPKKTHKEIDVWLSEIHGISYYIDGYNNVYSHNDIINNITNPSIIAKYITDADGNINIPSLFGEK